MIGVYNYNPFKTAIFIYPMQSNDILDDVLNLVSNLPLDTIHFHKQVNQLNRQLKACEDKLIRLYKRVICKKDVDLTMRRIKNYEDKARRIYANRNIAFEYLENAVKKVMYEIQMKLYPLRDELEIKISPPVEEARSQVDAETVYCVCKEKSHGDMVCCDSAGCEIGWFHFNCVGLTSAPRGVWFCEKCSRKRKGTK